jgi:hypothetical protein
MTQCTWKTPPSKELIEIPERAGMKCSTGGTLMRAAEGLKRSTHYGYLEFSLLELHKHIEQLRSEPTAETLGEFLSLWVE